VTQAERFLEDVAIICRDAEVFYGDWIAQIAALAAADSEEQVRAQLHRARKTALELAVAISRANRLIDDLDPGRLAAEGLDGVADHPRHMQPMLRMIGESVLQVVDATDPIALGERPIASVDAVQRAGSSRAAVRWRERWTPQGAPVAA